MVISWGVLLFVFVVLKGGFCIFTIPGGQAEWY
jgi:hypothetical protein